MDKSWINIRNRLDPLYEKGADDFVKFASKDRPNATEILCPCTKCRNMRFVKKVDVAEHIVVDGFLSSYTHWIFHGESSLTSSSIPEPAVGDRTQEMIRDAFGVPMFNQLDEIGSGEGNEDSDGLDDATKKFFNLVKEAEKEFEHHASIRRSNRRFRPHDVNKVHNETFHIWFRNHVQMLYEEGDEALSEEAISLAMGPLKKAERYTGYVINGFKYHTKARESNRATQHSGVMVKANTDSYASARDMNPIAGDVNYYGVLTDIIVLHYSKKFRFVLFKCDWVDNAPLVRDVRKVLVAMSDLEKEVNWFLAVLARSSSSLSGPCDVPNHPKLVVGLDLSLKKVKGMVMEDDGGSVEVVSVPGKVSEGVPPWQRWSIVMLKLEVVSSNWVLISPNFSRTY
ncbi:hypothetical protein RJ639_014929 [Escallonia herrerae]|uniref:Transposase-associated domain-containing protein n=1 Tax=Escallonia herrerae TaxID=1293975 RepID=A0AA88VFW2_9ASTE|nr:hypothetical protein RJ639_014929 [Escallonia herrerae]